jgi:hypothetical protein
VFAVAGNPIDGCATMEEAPKANFSIRGVSPRFAAVVMRGNCNFAGRFKFNHLERLIEILSSNRQSSPRAKCIV